MKKKRAIIIAGLITVFGIGGAGFIMMYFVQRKGLQEIFLFYPHSFFVQVVFGLSYGLLTGFLLQILLKTRSLANARHYFARLVKGYEVNSFDIFFISLCAGIGEEMFFRGAVQHWLGIWLTSIIFILLHGYFNPKDMPLFIYGTVLLVVSCGFGYLMLYSGIYAAMASHFIIDVMLLGYLKTRRQGV